MLVKQVLATVDLTSVYAPAHALGGWDATLTTLVNPLIDNVLIISGIVALGTLLLAGFNFITAAGDKTKTAQSSLMLTYGIIGLVVVVSAFLITRLMYAIFGITFI